jgi:2-methylcitrate dehydratase PrpD
VERDVRADGGGQVTDYLDRLARLAVETRYDDLSERARAAARLVILDTLGAMVAGSVLDENRRLARFAAARCAGGAATLLGHDLRSDAFWSALVNATSGVALEVDEGNRHGGGHPAIHCVPGALALAEERGVDGRRLMEAVVAGYEIASRLGSATTPRPDVHSHGTWGTIGTAVAAARLQGASSQATRETINLAASMSPANSWTPALAGATIRNLYPGRSAWQGLLAVELHAAGFTGLADGPADVYGGILADRYEPALAVANLGGRYRIEHNYFKLHACCRYNHYALEAVLDLRQRHRLTHDAIADVTVTTIPFGLRMADPDPRSRLAAKFSIPYAVAAALVLGHAGVAAFEPPHLGDGRIRDLAGRVVVREDAAMAPRRVDYPTARVVLRLRDGRTLEAETGIVRGDADDPVPEAEIVAKFLELTSPVLGERRAGEALHRVTELHTLKDARDLTAHLVPS